MEKIHQTYRAMKSKTCKSCSNQFTPKSGRQDYCTADYKRAYLFVPMKEREFVSDKEKIIRKCINFLMT